MLTHDTNDSVDAVYAEAYVKVAQFDIILDVLYVYPSRLCYISF
jgi:vesicle coat complex subunit